MRPTNYRTHHFHLFDKDISIGGMAGPHHNTDRKGALEHLAQHEKKEVLIGLHETDFSKDAQANGLEYHFIPIPDFNSSPVSPEKYDAVYDVVKKATEEGKGVTIHCGAGDGRTGTALASLKLRELLENAAKEDRSILDETPALTSSVHATMVHDHEVPCTSLVKAAVEEIRVRRTSLDESGRHSVETENEIQTLIKYEKHLRLLIKNELGSKKEASPTQPVVAKGSTASIAVLLAGGMKAAREQLKTGSISEETPKASVPSAAESITTAEEGLEKKDPRP